MQFFKVLDADLQIRFFILLRRIIRNQQTGATPLTQLAIHLYTYPSIHPRQLPILQLLHIIIKILFFYVCDYQQFFFLINKDVLNNY